MWVVHQRLAELWSVSKQRELTLAEMDEISHCLDANLKRAWDVAKLKNLSLVAYMVNDTDWQHSICKKLEKLTS